MKSILALAALFATESDYPFQSYKRRRILATQTEIDNELIRRKEKHIENKKKKGLKVFIIEGEEFWALNEKNAIKKYRRNKK